MPNNLPISCFFTLWTVLDPTLAISVVMGTNIKKAGIFIKPKLNGALIFKYFPEITKPMAPMIEIKKPNAAEHPIATFIG